jgi:hypothetical protein
MKNRFSFPVEDRHFKTSSYTNPGGIITRCVQVAVRPEGVALRDSKNPEGGTLFFTKDEFAAFALGVKNDEFKI